MTGLVWQHVAAEPAVHVAFAKVLDFQAGVHGLCRRSCLGCGRPWVPLPVWWLHCIEVALVPKETDLSGLEQKQGSP